VKSTLGGSPLVCLPHREARWQILAPRLGPLGQLPRSVRAQIALRAPGPPACKGQFPPRWPEFVGFGFDPPGPTAFGVVAYVGAKAVPRSLVRNWLGDLGDLLL